MAEPRYVDTPQTLAETCTALSGRAWLALDTEFVREKTYYPKLCLIQIAAAEDEVFCIDPLALDDLTPLWHLLYDPRITKVLHAAQQDLEIFTQLRGAPPTPVFDTQIAATLLGHGEQIGYANLVQALFEVELDKSQVRTDWSQRPLSAEQLAYAAADVSHLCRVYARQHAELSERGRLAWLAEDFAALVDPARYRIDPEQTWLRVKGAQRLKPRQLAVLRVLAAWREREAMARDRPRRWIADDNLLIDLARIQPRDDAQLDRLRGLSGEQRQRHGRTLLELIAAGRDLPAAEWPQPLRVEPLSLEQDALVDALAAIVKLCAAEHGVSPGSLAGRRELERLVLGEDGDLLHGWRAALAGKRVQAFLAGEHALRASTGQLYVSG